MTGKPERKLSRLLKRLLISQERITALAILRAALPPWHYLDDPLVQYDIRQGRRVGTRPWLLIFVLLGTLSLEIFYNGYGLLSGEYRSMDETEVLTDSLMILIGGLLIFVALAHWRLLLVILTRAAGLVTRRRQRGDMELILVTPVSRSRWLRAQLVIIGWQVWPLVRQLIVVQIYLVLVGGGLLLYEHHQNYQEEQVYLQNCQQQGGCYYYNYDDRYLPPVIAVLTILPAGLLLGFWPLMQVGVMATVALYVSGRSKRPAMAVMYGFFLMFVVRVMEAGVLVFSFIAALVINSELVYKIGWLNEGIDFGNIKISELIPVLLYITLYILGSSFFMEGLPGFQPLMVMSDVEYAAHLMVYISIMVAILLAYVAVPLMFIRLFFGRTVLRLLRRER